MLVVFLIVSYKLICLYAIFLCICNKEKSQFYFVVQSIYCTCILVPTKLQSISLQHQNKQNPQNERLSVSRKKLFNTNLKVQLFLTMQFMNSSSIA